MSGSSEKLYRRQFHKSLNNYYKDCEYRFASDFAWEAAVSASHISRLLAGEKLETSNTTLMGIANALAIRLVRNRESIEDIHKKREHFYKSLKILQDNDIEYFNNLHGKDKGIGGNLDNWEPRNKGQRLDHGPHS